jgi:hypothetical protein
MLINSTSLKRCVGITGVRSIAGITGLWIK